MSRTDALGADARSIWQAGVDAVDSARLVRGAITRDTDMLSVCGRRFDLSGPGRLVVVGAGKAGAGMASAVEEVLRPEWLTDRVTGWVNVPADCVRSLERITLHAARPAGVNEPTEEGVAGARAILELAGSLGPDDLGIVLLSGGGSALLPAPREGIALSDKQAVTRLLMHAGATINELNCVRKRLSAIKGGGLARAAAAAGALVTLVISDVVGDPLDVIASGPTVADPASDADALAVLDRFAGSAADVPPAVRAVLEQGVAEPQPVEPLTGTASIHVIGNNQAALSAAADRAAELGYNVHSLGSLNQGSARDEGVELLRLARAIRDGSGPVGSPACVLSGGEPVVQLVPTDRPRKGGRNQELVLAALAAARETGFERLVLLSGGTDGEDGPTDAAGAVADHALWTRAAELDPEPFLAINDSYTYFDTVGGLIRTGPTHTNVMDIRVALVASERE